MLILYNGELSNDFFEMQKDLRPDYAIEVGAHAAEFSIAMSQHFGIKATAFEANPAVFDVYKNTIDSDLISYVNYAISDRDETVLLKIHENPLAGNNSIKQRTNSSIIKSYEVQAYSLDSYFKDFEFENACMWVDAEGANKEVLSGAIEVLGRCSSIFIETEDMSFWEDQWLTNEVELFLSGHGFEKVAEEDVYSYQKNIIFKKRGC